MLAHVPSFGRNPRGSPDFLAYPVPKACMHVLGTGVLRCLGVARSASSPKAAQALGCSFTRGLRISFGRVTCMARAASVPRLWTLGFLLLRGACVWDWVVVWFGLRLRPATPGWGVGVCVRLCVRSACTLPLLAGVCGVGVCGWVRVPAAPRHLLAGVSGFLSACVRARLASRQSWQGYAALVCVLRLGFRLCPSTPGWGVGVCVCSCARSACTQPLLARVHAVGVCVWARVSAAPRHSWLGCWAVCVPVCALRLHPATPGTGARCGCVCLGSGFGCAPPLLAGVCVVGVCGWARVLAAPRHSWLGCWAVYVLVCALCLHPATLGTGVQCGCVCLGSGFGFAPPLLAGVLGCVCACVRALLAPSHSWHGCAVWVCVFGLRFRLRPAPPGRDFGLCVCFCGRSTCTPPLLAWMRAVGVCVLARVSAAPCHSWLGCWAVCVLVWALRLHSATPGWGARRGCVCLGSGFGCTPPLLARVLGCVCAGVGARLAPPHSWLGCAPWVCVVGLGFRLHPATPCWGVALCVCWCGRSACTPPLWAGVRAVGVCGCARVLAAPRHSWLGCAVWVCVFGLRPRLRAATPGWGVWLCVCSCARSACTQPLRPRVRGVGVCVWDRVSAAPRHSWLGCWGVCVTAAVTALRLYINVIRISMILRCTLVQ